MEKVKPRTRSHRPAKNWELRLYVAGQTPRSLAAFANLKKIGYQRRISVEATPADVATDAPKSIALLRRAFEP